MFKLSYGVDLKRNDFFGSLTFLGKMFLVCLRQGVHFFFKPMHDTKRGEALKLQYVHLEWIERMGESSETRRERQILERGKRKRDREGKRGREREREMERWREMKREGEREREKCTDRHTKIETDRRRER